MRNPWKSTSIGIYLCLIATIFGSYFNFSGNMSAIRYQKHHFFLVKDGMKHPFADRFTMNSLGFTADLIPYVGKDYLGSIPEGPRMPSLWNHHANKHMLSLAQNPGVFIDTPRKLLDLVNPAIAFWNGYLVVAWRVTERNVRVVVHPHSRNSTDIEHLCSTFTESSEDLSTIAVMNLENAEDPRLFVHKAGTSERLWMVVSRRHRKQTPEIQTSYMELFPDMAGPKLTHGQIIFADFRLTSEADQKNWSPFEYKSKLYFIAYISPHTIVESVTVSSKQGQHGRAAVLHKWEWASTPWTYGELRGGTEAHLIEHQGQQFYLAFFHSSNHPPPTGDVLKTYVMGAYTFSSAPPFAIEAITPVPIVHETMYSGRWADLPTSFYHIDYVVFPTSFILRGDVIYLLYGSQDKEGWLAKLSLSKLLSSMVPHTSLANTTIQRPPLCPTANWPSAEPTPLPIGASTAINPQSNPAPAIFAATATTLATTSSSSSVSLPAAPHKHHSAQANGPPPLPGPGNVSAIRYQKFNLYLVKDGAKSAFPDRYTMNTLGFTADRVPYVGKEYLNSIPNGPALQSLWDHHPNDRMLAHAKSPGVFLDTPKQVISLLNPAAVVWNGRLVVAWRATAKSVKVIVHPAPSGDELDLDKLFDSVMEHVEDVKSVAHVTIDNAEDPRLFVTKSEGGPDKLWMVFCRRYKKQKPEIQTSFVELIPKMDEAKIAFDYITYVDYRATSLADQKNWSPFLFETKMYFVGYVSPHTIVEAKVPNEKVPQLAVGSLLHKSDMGEFPWPYGELRGGTEAHLIEHQGQQFYLAFFHSSNHPPPTGDVLKTYVMGAYTFSSVPPFAIEAITPVPIVHETMYSGRWADLPTSFYHIDYVVFPTSFILRGDVIYLLYGSQDKEGWLAKLSLAKLLSSMVAIPLTASLNVKAFPSISDDVVTAFEMITCKPKVTDSGASALADLLKELNIEQARDLARLSIDDYRRIAKTLKPVQARKFLKLTNVEVVEEDSAASASPEWPVADVAAAFDLITSKHKLGDAGSALADLLKELKVEQAKDLERLTAEDFHKIAKHLKPVQARKFVKLLNAEGLDEGVK